MSDDESARDQRGFRTDTYDAVAKPHLKSEGRDMVAVWSTGLSRRLVRVMP